MDEKIMTIEPISTDQDDFQQIKGIGQAIARALYEAGIENFAELSEHSVESLAEIVQPWVSMVTPEKIGREDWIGQAHRLAGKQDGQPAIADNQTPPIDASPSEADMAGATAASHPLADDGPEPPLQLDRNNENNQPGMLPQLTGLSVSYHHPQVQVEYQLNISGDEALDATHERLPFAVELYLHDTDNRTTQMAHEHTGQLSPEQVEYQIEGWFPVPQPGNYQVYAIARLLPPADSPASLRQGRIVRVRRKSSE
jgi:hypothetical protein